MPDTSAATRLLEQIGASDRRAAEELLPLIYSELRKLARSRMARERPGQTLQPTALVHEAYLRLIGSEDPGWESRGHFFGATAEAMRRILIERARRVSRVKRGGDQKRTELSDQLASGNEPDTGELLAVDQALTRLEQRDPQMARW